MTSLTAETKELLKKLDTFPRKKLGQNFMVDPQALIFIKDALGLKEGERTLEIGPGLGFLTRHLLETKNKICAVEKDDVFAAHLESYFSPDRLKIYRADILKFDLRKELGADGPVKIAGNIPYNITSPIIEWLIAQKSSVSCAVLTVQKEVAERLTAKPGSKIWGSLSVFVQFHAQAELLRIISRGNFFPPPKVDSAVIRLTFPSEPLYPVRDAEFFSRIVRRAFQKRRKTLLNALLDPDSDKLNKNNLIKALKGTGIDPIRRPETLSIPDWVALSEAL